MDDQNKNLILATALSLAVILIWYLIFPPAEQAPNPDPIPPSEQTLDAGEVAALPPVVEDSAPPPAATEAAPPVADVPRVAIETPRLSGSVSLLGGRVDDLQLRSYRQTLEPDSETVQLLSPVGSNAPYYALYGWAARGGLAPDAVPGPFTEWTLESGDRLTPQSPVTLSWESPTGLIFRRKISIDDNYLFTFEQTVENPTGASVRMAPYGIVARHGKPTDLQGFFVLHEGAILMADGELQEIDYDDMTDLETAEQGAAAELVEVTRGRLDRLYRPLLDDRADPGAGHRLHRRRQVLRESRDIYQTEARWPAIEIAPGETAAATQYLFAGAKEWETIRDYESGMGIDRFVDSIDWGWFFFLTKPIFRALHFLHGLIGNMGLAIIILTFCIKAILFPLAYKSYVSMARMKELQPKMEALKERAGDDRQKLQQEMMQLYKTEKVNPASGCLPLILQIPIFFSLYKVIFVTIELRHAPFVGWIRDLSAPDPSSIYNLFGLLPWPAPETGTFLALIFIGLLPILLGISMFLQQKLNPAPTDPTQAMIFAYMPWLFMFMLGRFASGLVLYWITNNTITFTQQYIIMRSHGHRPDVFGNIRSSFSRKKAAEKK